MKPLKRRLLIMLTPLIIIGLGLLAWTTWSETHPEEERELRILIQSQLADWFPEQMTLPDHQLGFIPPTGMGAEHSTPRVILLHGLDEPGGIWDTLLGTLQAHGITAWEFRYPNDQAIDHSADKLAEYWPNLDADQPIILIGHSMGGLVIRDFVSRWRHPVDAPVQVDGPAVKGVILVGTPNHGSGWARFRVWLEMRELLESLPQQEFSLFASLRHGTGAAKIDLRPDSAFLQQLNARPWPEAVPIRIIGGLLSEPTPAMRESMAQLSTLLGDNRALAPPLEEWWDNLGEELGDGVVPMHSLRLDYAPPPLMVSASHRGLLEPTTFTNGPPPAIKPIVDILQEWMATYTNVYGNESFSTIKDLDQ